MACVTLKRSLDFDPVLPGCSPRPHKRRRCIPMCVSAAQSAHSSIAHTKPRSHFLDAAPSLTVEQIAQNVREEIRRLKRRKMFYLPEKGMECEGGYESPGSPPLLFPTTSGTTPTVVPLPQQSPPNREKPLFTFRQVNLICEQRLREREDMIREEYDKVLSAKLAEQYDCFVRFTADQIQQRLSQGALPSYLS